MKKGIFLLVFVMFALPLNAQIPANYYDAAVGKSGYELKSALSGIIFDHTALWYGYDGPGGLWHAFRTTDVRPDGYVWDIYSNCDFIPWEDGHVAGSGECMGGTQQEHTFCQSWMNYCETPLYSDMFHMYPVDGWVNGRRNNNPYGEVPDDEDWTTRWFNNGARLGYNAFVGEDMTSTCGIAYEPADEYKGDIARGFLYIATCYMFADSEFSEDYEMTVKSQLRPWALDMMLKWHRQDPVSQKEIDRNNLIYSQFQHNRNPYIDYPELAEIVFSKDSSNTAFNPAMARAPQNFTVTPAPNGQRQASLAWTNPTTCVNGNAAVLASIVIQRNGVVVHTISNPTPGVPTAWTDNNVPNNRTYEYRVFATTETGNGLLASAKAYIGQYCPVTVELFDNAYDGWDGEARIEFLDNDGNLLAFSKLPCGAGWKNVYDIQLPPETIHCVWIPGTANEENSFNIFDHELEEIYSAEESDVENFNGTFFTFNNDGCLQTAVPDICYAHDEQTICETELPYYYAAGDTTFLPGTASFGAYHFHLPSSAECDSALVLTLSVITSNETYEELHLCENDFPYYYAAGDTTFGPGTASDIFEFQHIANHCANTHNLLLYVYEIVHSEDEITISESDLPYTYHDTTFGIGTQTADYIIHFTSANACDSIVNLHLTVEPAAQPGERMVFAAWTFDDSYTDGVFGNDGTRNITANYGPQNGTATLYFNGTHGASDWTGNLAVTVNAGTTAGDPRGDEAVYGNALTASGYYNNGGSMTFAFSTIGYRGIQLQYAHRITSSGMRHFNYEWSTDGVNFTTTRDTIDEDGLGYYILRNIDFQNITEIDNVPTAFLRITMDGGTYWNGSCRLDNICLSGERLAAVVPDTTFADSIVCSYNIPFTWNGVTFHVSGTDTVTLENGNNLDSIVVMNVTIQEAETIEILYITENQLPYTWNGYTFTEEGEHTISRLMEGNCDNLLTMVLHVYRNDYIATTQTICDYDLPYHWGDLWFETAGTQQIVYQNQFGADSTVSYTLLVDTCTSVSEWGEARCGVWPNPSTGIFVVDVNGCAGEDVELRVYDAAGRKILQKSVTGPTREIDLSSYPVGIYTIEIRKMNKAVAVHKVTLMAR